MTDTVNLTLAIPKDLALAAQKAAEQNMISKSAWIRRAVREAARAAGVLEQQ
jgi:hypothetical protein